MEGVTARVGFASAALPLEVEFLGEIDDWLLPA